MLGIFFVPAMMAIYLSSPVLLMTPARLVSAFFIFASTSDRVYPLLRSGRLRLKGMWAGIKIRGEA